MIILEFDNSGWLPSINTDAALVTLAVFFFFFFLFFFLFFFFFNLLLAQASGSDASIDFDEGSVVRQLRRLDVSDSLAMFKFGEFTEMDLCCHQSKFGSMWITTLFMWAFRLPHGSRNRW